MKILAVLAFCAAIIAAAAVKQRRQECQEFDSAELIPAIRELAILADKLENADALVCDLHACSPRELLRGFRTNWIGTDGKQREIDFLADGRNEATAGLLAAAQEQREIVNGEIIDLLRAINAAMNDGSAPPLHCHAVDKTVDETTGAAGAGDWT